MSFTRPANPRRPRSAPWDAVLFDLDGTLADTVPLILTCFRHAMAIHRPGQIVDEVLLLANVGRTLRESMAELGDDPAEIDAIRTTYLDHQRKLHDQMVTPFPGALVQVERYATLGIPLAIVTSKGREMTRRTLQVCGLASHFQHVITADDVTRGKPDPEPVRIALERLGIAASARVAFIGDSPHDIVAGRAAGVRTIGVTWGAAPIESVRAAEPDHLITRFPQLADLEEA